jgi:chromate transporter
MTTAEEAKSMEFMDDDVINVDPPDSKVGASSSSFPPTDDAADATTTTTRKEDARAVVDGEVDVDVDGVDVRPTDDDHPALLEGHGGKSASELLIEDIPWIVRYREVIFAYAPLGFVSFGGPQAHVAILRDHLVVRRGWMDDESFTELFAIGQGLPGPTSTQLVVSTALARAGPIGGITAFLLFNIPGLVVLISCGVLISTFVDPDNPPWYLVGLPPAAISLVFQSFYGFGKGLDKLGIVLCFVSTLISILVNGDENISPDVTQFVYPLLLLVGGIISYVDSRREKPYGTYKSPSPGWDAESDLTMKRIGIPLWMGGLFFVLWAAVLTATVTIVGRAKAEGTAVNVYLETFEVMFRIGSLIFGGGQVVLPMLQDEVVPNWMTKDSFLQGLGLTQSMPGPLFNFSAYLGAVYQGVAGGLVAWVGIMGPGVILIFVGP